MAPLNHQITPPPQRLDSTSVLALIAALRAAYPQIAEDEETWLLTLESETDLVEFLRAVVRRRLEADAFVGGLGTYMTELKERQYRLEQRVAATRAMAFRVMEAARLKKIELAEATLSIRAGVAKVIITDEARLPDNCVRIKREPNKVAIKELLDRGEHVPGAELSNSEPTLSTRVK